MYETNMGSVIITYDATVMFAKMKKRDKG